MQFDVGGGRGEVTVYCGKSTYRQGHHLCELRKHYLCNATFSFQELPMRKFITTSALSLLLFFFAFTANAQIYNMSDNSVTDCSGTLFDSGGPSGSYAFGEDFEFTICPIGTPECIEIEFASFQLNLLDQLTIHDGPNSSATVVGAFSGVAQPTAVIRAASGCVTFHFVGVGLIPATGWELDWDCTFAPCPTPPPSPQDCINAIPICQDVYSEVNAYQGVGNVLDEINSGISCLGSGEKNDVWYTFTVAQSGDLNFSITPNTLTDDYDWAVYNLTNDPCEDIATNAALEVGCNYSGASGVTGPNNLGGAQNEPVIPVLEGETYTVNVSQFSVSIDGYTIDFGASTAEIFDELPPTISEVETPILCGSSLISFNTSENVLCASVADIDFQFDGPGGALHHIRR